MTSNGHSLCKLETIIQNETYGTTCDKLPIFIETKHWLDIYFSGKQPNFCPKIEYTGTNFQKKVWRSIMQLNIGETATYGKIAKRVGCKSAQAVGQAISRNPILLIIPCHRIIAANGKTGGYSAGIDKKIWLLKHETAEIN